MGKDRTKAIRVVCIIEAILLVGFIGYYVYLRLPTKASSGSAIASEPGYVPDDGFVATPVAAEAIGGAVIDQICGEFRLLKATVQYDENQQIWIVSKSYLIPSNPGAEVWIDQQTGRILKFLFFKD